MATFLQENRWFIARASTGCSSWDLCFSRLWGCCQSPGFWQMELGELRLDTACAWLIYLACHLYQTTKFRLCSYQQARDDESWRVQYAFRRATTQQDRGYGREQKLHRTNLRLR